ncbi:MAG TPA: BtpA/SgcQ family protein [Spirochaetia bacterium]|nr:BtpA/SgcQ family protein [Spirochaetia bacterium]
MSVLVDRIRSGKKAGIAMVQLDALPGSSMYRDGSLSQMIKVSVAEAQVLAEAGFDAIMLQNLGDLPVSHKVTPPQMAWMERVVVEVAAAVRIPVGLNFLENDAEANLSVASAAGLDFVRLKVFVGVMVTPFGLVSGCAHEAALTRNLLHAQDIAIFADVHDRTGINLGGRELEPDIRESVDLGHADGLVLTGGSFDESMAFLKKAKAKYARLPLLLGGSANETNLATALAVADGVIVSTALKDTDSAFGRVNPAKAAGFMKALRRIG